MKKFNVQAALLQAIAEKLGDEKSLVKELECFLPTSRACAYRKAKGESPLSFEEAYMLSKHYQINLDGLEPGESMPPIRFAY